MHYEAHELSLAFPDMSADQFRRLSADIKANGLNHEIILLEGKILDGRHRFKACLAQGVVPRFRQFREGDPSEASHGDAVAFVQSENAARRQLSESQLAYAITHPNILEFERRKACERIAAGGGDQKSGSASGRDPIAEAGRVSEKLAEKAGVGRRTVERAIAVRESGIEELNAAVAAGEIKLAMAEKIAHLNPAAQKRIVEAPAARRGDELQSAVIRSDSSKRRGNHKAGFKTALPQEPSTPFVRRFISALERLALVCAEEGAKDGAAIATRFLEEMDWNAEGLVLQLDRAEPAIRAMAIIQQRRIHSAAKRA